jgi:DNA invertase Pin-like site-specific DNA recombinase
MILGYIRVSTAKQELENQKSVLYEFARSRKLFIDKFIEAEVSSRQKQDKRKLDEVFTVLNKGDLLLVTELSRLGRSLSEILGIVNKLIESGVMLITVKENVHIKGKHSMQSKMTISMFALFAELERDLISARTKEALAIKKAQGVQLGRPKGPGKSKLNKHQAQIQELLDKKVSMLSISKILGVSYPTLFNFIKVRKMRSKIIKKIAKDATKTMRVKLSLFVENNSSFVRGKKNYRIFCIVFI